MFAVMSNDKTTTNKFKIANRAANRYKIVRGFAGEMVRWNLETHEVTTEPVS